MNTERPEVVSKRRASPVEGEPASKRTKRTVEIPGLVTEVMSSNHAILETVFSQLSPRDIKMAALVSRTWRMVTETPRYWTKMRLNVHKENISQVLKSRVIQLVSVIKFESLGLNKNNFSVL